MHISDGVIPGSVCIAAAIATTALTLISLKKTTQEQIPKISVFSAVFFIASLIHFKIGPSSTHLILNGLIGIILGSSSFLAIVVGLFFQFIMFQHGGVTTFGINAIIMGMPAICSWLIFRVIAKKISKKPWYSIPSFVAGFLGVFIAAFLTVFFLRMAGKEFNTLSQFIFYINLPVAFIEGMITTLIVLFLLKIKPDIIVDP